MLAKQTYKNKLVSYKHSNPGMWKQLSKISIHELQVPPIVHHPLQQWRLSIIIVSKKEVFSSSSKYQMNDAARKIFNCSNPKKERNLYI